MTEQQPPEDTQTKDKNTGETSDSAAPSSPVDSSSSPPTSEPGTASEIEPELSLEDLDAAIKEADPEFVASLEAIGPDDPHHKIYEEGIELQFQFEDELKFWQEAGGKKARLAKIFPFLIQLSYQIKIKRTALRLHLKELRSRAIASIKNAPKAALNGIKGILGAVKEKVGAGLGAFKSFTLIQKLIFVGLIVITVGSAAFIARIATKGLIPEHDELFVSSLAEWAEQKHLIEEDAPFESFYESTRTVHNVLLMKKMVANIKRSANSGENPMAAFEFIIEGTVAEVVIEVKDRESEIRDMFLRIIEDMNFDQLDSAEGKRLLCVRLRKEVNKMLTTGFIRKVYFKTAIIKP